MCIFRRNAPCCDAVFCMLSVLLFDSASLYIFAADVDEQSKREIKDVLMQYDRTLLVADPRRC